jgi:hypothetical protein
LSDAVAEPPNTAAEGPAGEPVPPSRARLALAGGAAVLLAALVGVALVTSSSQDEVSESGDCVAEWNSSSSALRDGRHGYAAHDYRAVLVGRATDEGKVVSSDDPALRCAVVFAAAKVDFEPDFGVRVLSQSSWQGLFFTDGVPLDEIERIQQRALEEANATVGADGTITLD